MCCVIRSDTIKRIEKTPQKAKNEKKAREKQNKQQNQKERKNKQNKSRQVTQFTSYRLQVLGQNSKRTKDNTPSFSPLPKRAVQCAGCTDGCAMCCAWSWCISVYSDFGKRDSTASIQGEHSDRKSTLKLNSSYYIAPIAQ